MHDCGDTTAGEESGQALVEFALILPILMMILLGVFEFGTAFWSYQQVSAAASEGARRAAVSRTANDKTGVVTTAVRNAAPNLDADDLNVALNPGGGATWAPGSSVSVTVTYPEDVRILGISIWDDNLTVTRTARVEA